MEPEKQGQLQHHLAALLDRGFEPITLDQDVITSARLSLNQVPLAQLLYGRIKRDYHASEKQPYQISKVLGPGGGKVFERISGESLDKGMSSLFTYQGYHDFFKKQIKNIAQQSSEENWVLDPDKEALTEPEIEHLQTEMQNLYFAEYIRNWQRLLADIGIIRFTSLQQAADRLALLSSPNSPMRTLLQNVAYNTTLVQPVGLLAKAEEATATKNRLSRLFSLAPDKEALPLPKNPAEVVDKAFAQLNEMVKTPEGGVAPIEPIIELLSQLYGQMDAMAVELGADALSFAMGSAGADIIRNLQNESTRQPEPVKRWLEQIASNSRAVTMGGARAQVNEAWKSKVYAVCDKAVTGRYPIYRDSQKEITLVDFGRLFAPGGLIDGFFQANLKPFVNTSGGKWRWKPVGNASLGIPTSVLQQFRRAALIRDTFFQGGGDLPSVRFGLKPVYLDANVKTFRLDLEGQKFQYRHGPTRIHRAQWPGPASTGQVSFVFEDGSGARLSSSREGPWAWFRILDKADLKATSSDRLIATFESAGRKSSWEIQASSVVNPFMMKDLEQFRCPGRL
jgi:type VI secretion system protein ImpL